MYSTCTMHACMHELRRGLTEPTSASSSHVLQHETASRVAVTRPCPRERRGRSAERGGGRTGPSLDPEVARLDCWTREPIRRRRHCQAGGARGCRPRRTRIGPNQAKNWWASSPGRAVSSRCPRRGQLAARGRSRGRPRCPAPLVRLRTSRTLTSKLQRTVGRNHPK